MKWCSSDHFVMGRRHRSTLIYSNKDSSRITRCQHDLSWGGCGIAADAKSTEQQTGHKPDFA